MRRDYKTVLFICTGNFYRSRFSECLFNALAGEQGLSWRATSRGLKTWTVGSHEGPVSELAAYRLTAMGVPFDRARFPRQLSRADLETADLVIALKKTEHHAMMRDQFPAWAERITYWHIDDIDCATADESLPVCESRVRFLISSLLVKQQHAESSVLLGGVA
jgi:protein-tyrosine phosphatase